MLFAAILHLCLPLWAVSDIEKRGVLTDKGIELHWWPKMPPIQGWVKPGQMDNADISPLVPKGSTFDNARSVIYGKADYIPRMEKGITLAKLIAEDIAGCKENYPHARITRLADMITAKGKHMTTLLYEYDPARDITHDKVAFCKEGPFFVIITLSSKNLAAYKKDVATFDAEVARYR